MPRHLGQIDARKHEAILGAAVEVLAERGVHAPIEEIARRAGVSKQTVYNHYGSKTDLVRTLVERRRETIIAPLEQAGADARPEETLTAYARQILEAIISPASIQLLRMAVSSANALPELTLAIYDTGQRASRLRLAEYLANLRSDEIAIDDPKRASEIFMGMVIGVIQIRTLMGLEVGLDPAEIPERARDCTMRFLRAFAADPAGSGAAAGAAASVRVQVNGSGPKPLS